MHIEGDELWRLDESDKNFIGGKSGGYVNKCGNWKRFMKLAILFHVICSCQRVTIPDNYWTTAVIRLHGILGFLTWGKELG